jgi:hypothetical protein
MIRQSFYFSISHLPSAGAERNSKAQQQPQHPSKPGTAKGMQHEESLTWGGANLNDQEGPDPS